MKFSYVVASKKRLHKLLITDYRFLFRHFDLHLAGCIEKAQFFTFCLDMIFYEQLQSPSTLIFKVVKVKVYIIPGL